jgi:glycosyltransferase A (GT-A) superfamily protein (DUF2064 family)
LWAAPDAAHPVFQAVRARHGTRLERQSEGDLGARMHAAMAAAKGPALVIGTDCPALTASDLRRAAETVRLNTDAVIFPAEDGGYGLIGLRAPLRAVFVAIGWGTNRVLGETRRRFKELGLTWQEPVTLWDLDLPADIDRLADLGLDPFAQS